MEIALTKHAYTRIKERLGLNKNAAQRIATIAYREGIRHGEVKGRLSKYISGITQSYQKEGACNVLYGEHVYCFVDDAVRDRTVLVTVFGVPKTYLKNSLGLQKRKRIPEGKGG